MSVPLEGPYLAAAVFCERVLEEKDGVLSIIRVIDRIVQTVAGPKVPDKMPRVPIGITAVISFKSGFARGRMDMTFRPNSPSGMRLPEVSVPVQFEGEDRGANIILPMSFEATEEGLYWFDVVLGERLITRMPLRVVYQAVRFGGRTGPEVPGTQPGL